MAELLKGITALGHACFRLDLAKCIYIDPYQLPENARPADIIICTHEHFDHCSPEDIARIRTKETTLVAPADCVAKIGGNVRIIAPGMSLEVDGIRIEGVPAYNTNKEFHPKSKKWVGVIVDDGTRRIYHVGDSDIIPEMKKVNADVWLVPVSGTYVMTAEEAAKIVNECKPAACVPMHYGVVAGDRRDAERFVRKVGKTATIL